MIKGLTHRLSYLVYVCQQSRHRQRKHVSTHSFARFLSFHFHWPLPHGPSDRSIAWKASLMGWTTNQIVNGWGAFNMDDLCFSTSYLESFSPQKIYHCFLYGGSEEQMFIWFMHPHPTMNDLCIIIILPWTDLFMRNLSLSISNPQINTVRNGKTYWWDSVDRLTHGLHLLSSVCKTIDQFWKPMITQNA